MNQRYQNFLREIAQESTLHLDPTANVLFGSRGGYTVYVAPVNQSNAMTITVSVNRCGELPDASELHGFTKSTKLLTACHVTRYKAVFSVRGSGQKIIPQRVNEALSLLVEFLRQNGYSNCCEGCGQEKETDTYCLRGAATLLCEDCFAQKSAAVDARQQIVSQKHENVVGGIVGALLGALVGAVVIVLLGQLGYVAALSGIVMAVCTVKGYELLGGRLSNVGIGASVVAMLIMVYVGNRMDWAWTAANYFDADLFTAFRAVPYMIRQGMIESATYNGHLITVYLFTLVGAVPTIIASVRNRDRSAVTGRLQAELQ